jgi:hypothetical protein
MLVMGWWNDGRGGEIRMQGEGESDQTWSDRCSLTSERPTVDSEGYVCSVSATHRSV